MTKGIIFDMDGTLFDSLSMWEKVDANYLASIGVPVTDALSRHFFKLSLSESATYISETFRPDLSPQRIEKDMTKMAGDYYLHEVPLKKGVMKVLNTFAKKHLPMTIATSNQAVIVRRVLDAHHLSDYFVKVLTVEEEGVGKESAQIYEHACSYMHTKPQETVVFEDALHALKTAHQAGFVTVGCYDAYSAKDQPAISKMADYYVESMDEILDVDDFKRKL